MTAPNTMTPEQAQWLKAILLDAQARAFAGMTEKTPKTAKHPEGRPRTRMAIQSAKYELGVVQAVMAALGLGEQA